MIASFVNGLGSLAVDIARESDRPESIAAWLTGAARDSDLVITTGGASVGDHDCVAEAWTMAGIETRFWKVAVKPGKPLRFGVMDQEGRSVPVLALPGNPLAVLSALEQLIGPALDRLGGRPARTRPRLRVPLVADLSKRVGRAHLVRGAVTEQGFEPARAQGSHLLGAAARSGAVGHLSRHVERLEAGSSIDVEVEPNDLSGKVLRIQSASPRVVCVSGDSNAGKTQVVEALVVGLTARGARVGTVKHATHEVALDTPGKDSWRHAEAGAEVVVLVGPDKSAVFRASTMDRFHDWMAPFDGQVDWVIIEGFRELQLPRIEVVTGEVEDLERLDVPSAQWRLTRSGGLGDELVERLVDAVVVELDDLER